MSTFTIGEVAERSGFTASSLRFYEEQGLVRPAARTAAGYRVYDDAVLTRLKFIRRAKELGCSLEEIVELTALLDGERCEPVQARLHELVTARIADAERRRTELAEFTGQLRAAAALLGDTPTEGGCQDGCACMTSPAVENQPVTISCSLSAAEVPSRVRAWEDVLTHVVNREWTGTDGLRLTFADTIDLSELASLVSAEQGCCAFFDFAITVDNRGVALEVGTPPDGRDVLIALYGQPD